jgi:polyhydroxyalkanoate synthesis regulator phasin
MMRKIGEEHDKLLSSINDRMGNTGSDSSRTRGVTQSDINELKEGLKSLGKRTNGLEQIS